jgi:hypothetical protein
LSRRVGRPHAAGYLDALAALDQRVGDAARWHADIERFSKRPGCAAVLFFMSTS